MRIIVKIGSSSLTASDGTLNTETIQKLTGEIALQKSQGNDVVLVSSGAVSAGISAIGHSPGERPTEPAQLRAASAAGQVKLMDCYSRSFAELGLGVAQVLLTPADLWSRQRYLNGRGTLEALLRTKNVPIVNENDAVAEDKIRFGDNDRLAALVAHLMNADLLMLLTDTAGLFTSDPRADSEASLIEEIEQIDGYLESAAGSGGSEIGTGGMESKLAAAKISTWSGIRTIIASSHRTNVIGDALQNESVGTVFHPKESRLSARKLWIAFAKKPEGTITVDRGARTALEVNARSLLPAGVSSASGEFETGDAVELADESGQVFARGLSRWTHAEVEKYKKVNTADLPAEMPHVLVHRDDLLIIPNN